jgi:hypothetical protein
MYLSHFERLLDGNRETGISVALANGRVLSDEDQPPSWRPHTG